MLDCAISVTDTRRLILDDNWIIGEEDGSK